VLSRGRGSAKEEFAERIKYYGDHFWLLFEGDKLIAFLDGFVTDEPDLTDEMYAKASMHDENGAWQMLFGLNTLPEYRKNGYAANCSTVPLRMRESRGERVQS